MKNKVWITFQVVQFIIFFCVALFLLMRTIDGHGAIQTTGAKLMSFGIWAVFYGFVLAIEWIVYFMIHRSRK